ncbi:MAG: carboxypeptidase regulatory-like domain-containing protein [Terriglobales bacterium]
MQAQFRKLGLALLAIALVLTMSVGAWAQGTGELTGVVHDPVGAVVAKVPVKLVNTATGVTYTTETSAAGVYRFASLPVVGTYTLTVEPQGFQTYKVSGIVVSVGTTVTRDVTLTLGKTTEVVNVEAGVELVQTSESQVSQLIDRRIWESMPNATRDSNSFLELIAGSVPDAQAGSTRGAAINGARGGTGNFLVEGIDNNDQGQGGRGQLGDTAGGAVTSISPEAIQEYRVITNSFAAEYGKAGGFVTDTVLKSGTNSFHGSLFEYNRVQALAANDFFSNRTEDPFRPGKPIKDSLVRNQFGGSIGGPVIKDKTFFFTSAEIHRRRSSEPIHASAVNPAFMDWVKSGGLQQWAESDPFGICMQNLGEPCVGAFSHSGTTGAIFNTLAAIGPFPLANGAARPCYSTSDLNDPNLYNSGVNPCAGQGFWTTPDYDYRYATIYPMSPYGDLWVQNPSFLNEYRITGKFDHKFSDKDQFSAMYLLQDAESGDPYNGGGTTIGPPYLNQGRSQNLGLTWNHSFTPTVLNTFKAGYLRHVSNFPETRPGMPEIYTAFDELSVGLGMYGGLPQFFTDNQFQFQDHLSFVRGKHSFKAGAEYRRTRNGSSFYNGNKGSFYPFGVEDMLTDFYFSDEVDQVLFGESTYGSLYYATASVDLTTGQEPDVYRGFRANEMAAYFQDDWRITNRLTINLGLRYEYFGPPHNFKENIDSNFYFGSVGVTPIPTTSTNPYFPRWSGFYAGVANGTFQIRNNEIWGKDTNNFAPRVGFAFDVLGNQKLVLRAGAGIMYDRIYNNVFENIRFNPPHFSNNQIGYFANGVPSGAIATPGLFTYPFSTTTMFADPRYAPKPNPRHMDQDTVSPYYEQLHLGLQYEFAKGYVVEPRYVGTFGHKLLGYRDINTFNGRMVSGLGSTRINPNIGADNYRSNDYSSNYHGFQLTVRKAYSSGLQFNSAYTYSKALDTISDLFNSRTAATVTDTMNIKNDYGPADFDMRHRWVTSLSYDLPFMKNNRWLGGWGVNSIISIQSGVPFTPFSSSSSYDLNKNGLNTDRIVTKGVSPMSTTNGITQPPLTWGTPVTYFDGTQWTRYTCPVSVNNGQWCNPPLGRNSMTGPAYQNVDFGVTKSFKITEGSKLQFQANFFNLFNHTNFGLPNRNQTSGDFGKITSAYDARETQLALRFDF